MEQYLPPQSSRRRILILGAGISGLSAAWYLSRSQVPLDVTILEKSPRAGGWLHTDCTHGFHFERGPRSFKVSRAPALIQLAVELDLSGEILTAPPQAHQRYLYFDQKLHRLPTNPFSFLLSPLTKGVISALCTEWKKLAQHGDESVWDFVVRRFNVSVARRLFAPMVVGIFGSDAREISIKACFPTLKAWEEEMGSVTKGCWRAIQDKKGRSRFSPSVPDLPLSAMVSFRGGMEQLVQTLVAQVPAQIHYGCEVIGIARTGESMEVTTSQGVFTADALFCALPVHEAARLMAQAAPEAAGLLAQVSSVGLRVVHLAYTEPVLPLQGFGYLTSAEDEILGTVFDSSAFPAHNRQPQETRLSVMLRDEGQSEAVSLKAAREGLKRHLGLTAAPAQAFVTYAPQAIPQYSVGHLERMQACLSSFQGAMSGCHLLGNYLTGVSVDHCIRRAQDVVDKCLVSLS